MLEWVQEPEKPPKSHVGHLLPSDGVGVSIESGTAQTMLELLIGTVARPTWPSTE